LRRWVESRRLHLLVLLALCLVTFLGRQQDRGLPSFDDAYYAVKSREMLTAGNRWVVHYNGEPSWDNPPFHFWLTAGSYRLFGISDFTSVLATGLMATASVLLCYVLALALFGSASLALLAALILLLPGFFLDYARRGMMDPTVVFLTLAALHALWRADRRPLWYPLAGLAAGCAILTKSVIGAFPLVIAAGYLLLTRRPRRLVHPWALTGLLVALGLAGIWLAENYRAGGRAFIDAHFGWLLMERAMIDPGDRSPWFFLGYLKLLAQNYWPWLPFTLWGAWRMAGEYRRERSGRVALLLFWPLVIIGVMSLTRNQFLRYILAVFPALAILAAYALHGLARRYRKLPHLLAALLAVAALVAILINATAIVPAGSTGLVRHSVDVKALAPLVREHTPAGTELLNYRLPRWDPRNAMLFYSERFLGEPISEPDSLLVRLEREPALKLLTSPRGFEQLETAAPGRLVVLGRSGGLVYVARRSAGPQTDWNADI